MLLHELGFVDQHVRLQVYPHLLPSSRHVVEWVKGTTLTRFVKAVLPDDVFERFLAAYEQRLLDGDRRPRAVLLPVPADPHVGPARRVTPPRPATTSPWSKANTTAAARSRRCSFEKMLPT